MDRVDGKIALVTGGANGIGRAISKILASEGARVAVGDLDEDEGRQAAEEIQKEGGEAKFFRLDVTDEESVREVIGSVSEQFGELDVLVNNAGITGPGTPTHEVSVEEWEAVFAVNVKGAFLCTKYTVPHMRENGGGSIVNFSSIYGIIGNADSPTYHASKGAIRLASKTDAVVYAKENIRVNSVHPGTTLTPLVRELAERDPDYLEQMKALHPLGRFAEPEEIAYGVLYLASDESSFVTGSELVIDGGFTAQ